MKDKVVIITGGSSGIGRALAAVFGQHGSKILITGRNATDLQEAVKDLRKKGIDAHGFASDVSKEEDNRNMATEALRLFGRIDILVNNAGVAMRALFEEVDMDVIRKIMDTNFYGAIYATRACLPEIMRNKGSVIGISSAAGFRGLPGRVAYSSSKFALNGFLEVLRTEMMKKGVHVLTACPGFTTSNIRVRALTKDGSPQKDSPRNEKKMMSAEECARHIYQATVKRKKILILTTQGKFFVFLNKWLPGLTDHLVYNAAVKEENSPFK